MKLPGELMRMKRGCLRPRLRFDAPLAGAEAYPAAWARVPSQRVEGRNDICGDCVETAMANAAAAALVAQRGWDQPTIDNGYPQLLYSQIAGYKAGDAATDRGTDPAAALNWWLNEAPNGVAGVRLKSATPFDPTKLYERRAAIKKSLGFMLIVDLAIEQQNQRVWTPAGSPGTWGLHCLWVDQYAGSLSSGTSWGEETSIDETYFTAAGFAVAAFQLTMAVS